MQTPRDSTIAVEAAEGLAATFEEAMADGNICDFEAERIKRGIQRVQAAAVVSDLATALQVNVGRGGLDGDRFVELANDYRRMKPLVADEAGFDDAA